MKTIIYNRSESGLTPNLEAFATRAGYLLTDLTINAGGTHATIFTDYTVDDLSFKQKIRFLEVCDKEGEQGETIKIVKHALKENARIKHKTPQQIRALKKLEQSLAVICNDIISEFQNHLRLSGLLELRYLQDEKILDFYHINNDPEDDSNDSVCASKLLQLSDTDADEGPEMFFLPGEFFSDEFSENFEDHNSSDIESHDPNKSYYDCCFTLPNINLLSAAELKTVRKQLCTAGALYRANSTEWMRLCYSTPDILNRIDYFKTHVLPAAQTLQQAIEQNEILQHCSKFQYDSVKINVHMGEIPVYLLWKFYKDFKVIAESTWEKLNGIKKEGLMQHQRWPFMVLEFPNEEKKEGTLPEFQPEIASVKKSILVD